MRRIKPSSRVVTTGIAAAGLLALAISAPQASADTSPTKASPKKAASLAKQLGDAKAAGTYIDAKTKQTVVNVTDAAAADEVRAAGATPRIVERSGARLESVKSALDRKTLVAGSAWAVDPKTNQVVVSVDKTVTGKKLATVRKALSSYGESVELRRAKGTYSTKITGGDAIWGDGGRCSLGFNVVYDSDPNKHAFLTAGHCGEAITTWSEDQGGSDVLGDTVDYSFPDNDYAIVDYNADYTDHPSAVGSQTITAAGTPTVGETVNRAGSTTGNHDGDVLALDATVQYPEGIVNGLIHTDVCAEPGDSGGSLYAGETAYGLTSGGSGNCTSGGETFFQPVQEALDVYQVSIP
ncbi:MAG: trypsin-like serine protease [Streptosporangiales bacterium]|nr:trypsin-like serine protease [Streptosporangiales bacterium]